MNLIIDANILFAGIIKNNITLNLIYNEQITLFAPEYIWEEFEKYKNYLLKKTKQTEEKFNKLIETLKKIVNTIPYNDIEPFLSDAKKFCPDLGDIQYFALALKLKYPIWSNDKILTEQKNIKIYSTEDLLKLIKWME